MRALEIFELTGPDSALRVTQLPDPGTSHLFTPGEGVLVEVHAAGVAFPDVLQSRGEYQLQPPLPFVPGSEVAGIVRSTSAGSRFSPGDRVAGFCMLGGYAELATTPEWLTFPLPEALDFRQGAALILNYHTAYFSLVTRGRLISGETVLVHGAAGGVGTAALQVAKGLGARTIAVVSTEAKEQVAREAGADEVVRADGFKDAIRALGGADVVFDPVGGDRFTDSLRCLREGGRLLVVGFTGGSIPEVKVNRLLLGNTEVIGSGWVTYALAHPEENLRIGEELEALVVSGAVRPIVGARFPLADAGDALRMIDGRTATGKVVLDVQP